MELKKLIDSIKELVMASPENIYTPKQEFEYSITEYSYTEGNCLNSSQGCLIGQALLKLDSGCYEILNVQRCNAEKNAD